MQGNVRDYWEALLEYWQGRVEAAKIEERVAGLPAQDLHIAGTQKVIRDRYRHYAIEALKEAHANAS